MLIPAVYRGAFLCFFLIISLSGCNGEDESKKVEVVGIAECADCAHTNIKNSQALSGLHVTIECKPKNGNFRTRGVGQVDHEGKFKVDLPCDMVKNGNLMEECYAQLHSASATPCPTLSGLQSSKILLKSQNNQIYSFGLAGKLTISPPTCTSEFLWPPFNYPKLPHFKPKWKIPSLNYFGHPHLFPPFPHNIFPPHHHHKLFPPKFHHPPSVPIYKPPPKELPPPVPIYKPPPKELPPPVPTYNPPPCPPKVLPPPVPIYKPPPKVLPPPVPIYKPPPKELPPPVPMYKPPPKVLPPPVPIKKPCPPKVYFPPKLPLHKPPPVPIYKPKHPIFHHKPLPPMPKLPPIPKIPPFHKKPCPPLPKLPPFPKIPPKYLHHPKFGKWPPIPSINPIH